MANSPVTNKNHPDYIAPYKRWGTKNPIIYAILVVFLVLIIIAFVFLPSSGKFLGSNTGVYTFGTYNGKPITNEPGSYFNQQVEYMRRNYPAQGSDPQSQLLYNYNILQQSFRASVVQIGILDEIEAAGFRVSDHSIDVAMAQSPRFQEGGVFSEKLYNETSQTEKLAMRRDFREALMRQTYSNLVNGDRPSTAETNFIKEMAKPVRTIQYAMLPLSSYPDSEVLAWASQNGKLFRKLTLSRIEVSTTKADLEKILKEVQNKKTPFETAAKNATGIYAASSGKMGQKYYYEISNELSTSTDAEQLTSLAKDGLSPIFKTVNNSFVVYRIDAPSAAADFTSSADIAAAKKYMIEYERGKIEDFILKQMKATFKDAKTFEADAKAANMVVKTTNPFPLNYGDISLGEQPLFKKIDTTAAPELRTASSNEQFLTAVFKTPVDSFADPIVLGDQVIAIKVLSAELTPDADLAQLEYTYRYLVQQGINTEMNSKFTKSPKLKDNFTDVYLKQIYGPTLKQQQTSTN